MFRYLLYIIISEWNGKIVLDVVKFIKKWIKFWKT